MKNLFTKLSLLFASVMMTVCFITSSVFAIPSIYPTGTTIYYPGETYDGYTLYYSGGKQQILLISMTGNIVHSWEHADYSFINPEPLPNGNILVNATRLIDDVKGVVELDWDSNVVWEYFDDLACKVAHHDHERLGNGYTLILCRDDVDVPEISPKTLKDDHIIVVNPAKEVVWEWQTWEHFDEFGFSDEAKALISDKGGDWAHANAASILPTNSIPDQRFNKGNIIVSQRNTNIIFIIDKDTGQVVWKIGPNDNITIGQHNAHMIAQGLPDAGAIIVFDNGGSAGYPTEARNYSRVIEIHPVTKEIIREYNATTSGRTGWTFFSHFISGMQRLPNGNTLINEGSNGRFFEVSSSGKIVWEYIVPYFTFDTRQNGWTNHVYRVWRVGPDWPPVSAK